MLDERKSAILQAVIEEYTETAQPVGSSAVVASPAVAVSPATVRLESDGYLEQPHTSAGRVPTEKGYRYFVDHLNQARLSGAQNYQVSQFFDHLRGEIEQVMQDTAGLLTTMTDYAAVVVDDTDDAAAVVSVQLVRLGDRNGLCVVVLDNGQIVKQSLDLPELISDVELVRAQSALSAALDTRTLTDPGIPLPSGSNEVDALVVDVMQTMTKVDNESGRVYMDGASRVANAFQAVDSVSRVLTILEQQLVVVNVLADVVERGLTVAIGTETGVDPLSECSLVVSPYEVDGEHAGSIAVLGPTRMNYPQAMSAVAAISTQLGYRLSEG